MAHPYQNYRNFFRRNYWSYKNLHKIWFLDIVSTFIFLFRKIFVRPIISPEKITRLNSTVRALNQARSHGCFQPRINSHISYTKTNILTIKTPSTSNSNNNYAKFTKKNLNHYFLGKIYLGLLSLLLSSRRSIVASNCRPYHVYCRFGKLSTNRFWYVFSGDVESRDKYRHLGIFKNYFLSTVENDRKNGNGLSVVETRVIEPESG